MKKEVERQRLSLSEKSKNETDKYTALEKVMQGYLEQLKWLNREYEANNITDGNSLYDALFTECKVPLVIRRAVPGLAGRRDARDNLPQSESIEENQAAWDQMQQAA